MLQLKLVFEMDLSSLNSRHKVAGAIICNFYDHVRCTYLPLFTDWPSRLPEGSVGIPVFLEQSIWRLKFRPTWHWSWRLDTSRPEPRYPSVTERIAACITINKVRASWGSSTPVDRCIICVDNENVGLYISWCTAGNSALLCHLFCHISCCEAAKVIVNTCSAMRYLINRQVRLMRLAHFFEIRLGIG